MLERSGCAHVCSCHHMASLGRGSQAARHAHTCHVGQSRCVNRSTLANTWWRCDQVCPNPLCWVGQGSHVNRHTQAACAVLGYCVGVNRYTHASASRAGTMAQVQKGDLAPQGAGARTQQSCKQTYLSHQCDLTDTPPQVCSCHQDLGLGHSRRKQA